MPGRPQELLTAAPALIAGVLRQFGRARLRAVGGSMFPVVRSGDTLTIEHCTLDEVHLGDVVLVLEGDRLYAHRLVDTPVVGGERWLVTRGDAHWERDPPRPASSLLGRVVSVERNDKVLSEPFGASPMGRVVGLLVSDWTHLRARARDFLRASTS